MGRPNMGSTFTKDGRRAIRHQLRDPQFVLTFKKTLAFYRIVAASYWPRERSLGGIDHAHLTKLPNQGSNVVIQPAFQPMSVPGLTRGVGMIRRCRGSYLV